MKKYCQIAFQETPVGVSARILYERLAVSCEKARLGICWWATSNILRPRTHVRRTEEERDIFRKGRAVLFAKGASEVPFH